MATAYGAQANGLICGYRFSPAESGRPIDLAEAIEWLKVPLREEPSAFIWLHFDLTHASAQAWMETHLSLTQEFFDTLRQGSRSTRIEDAQDNLIAVINDVAYEFAFDPSEIATLWMSVAERVAISARTHPLRSIDRLRVAVNEGARFSSSVDLLNNLMHDQGDVLVRIAREATLKVDAIEDSLLRGTLKQRRAEMGKLRRVLVRLQRLLAPEPAALFRLLSRPPRWVRDEDVRTMQQSAEEFSAAVADSAALVERLKLIQEELASLINEQNNRILFVLTMVTVLALPVNLIAGLFGMNVGGIPLAQADHGFATIILIVATLTAAIAFLAVRSRR
jgi:zinc transporter